MKVSVIIPAYNSAKTLCQCLTSVSEQNFENFEIIVVDNNSTDTSKEIILIHQKKDEKIKYVFEKTRSRGAARNRGIKESEGEIIIMIDSDCKAPQNWIAEITKPIINGREEVVMGNDTLVGNNFISRHREISRQNFKKKMNEKNYINYFDTKNCAFKKNILKKSGSFDVNMKSKEDVDFGLRLLAFDPEAGNMEDYDIGMALLTKKTKFYFLPDCKVEHYHPLSLFGWIGQVIDKAYYLRKSFEKNKKILKLLPKKSYNKMDWQEFFSFFYHAPCSLLFNKKNDEIFFEILIGFFHRIGIIKYELRSLIR